MIRKVGDTTIQQYHRLVCHCECIELELHLPNGIEKMNRCNCSLCRRKGAIVATIPITGLTFIRGEKEILMYQFKTKTAKHYFCPTCGIYTHHQRRSNPLEFGYNTGCLVGVDPFLLGEIPTTDGVNHTSDRT